MTGIIGIHMITSTEHDMNYVKWIFVAALLALFFVIGPNLYLYFSQLFK